MTCCNSTVKELLNDCCSGDCADESTCTPLFDVSSPVEGQSLKYSEEFNAFINVTVPEIPIAFSTDTRIALLGYDNFGQLKVWYFDIGSQGNPISLVS